MTRDEWGELVAMINGLWPGRALPAEAVTAWWHRLRNREHVDVHRALEQLSISEDRRPSLAQIDLTVRGLKARRTAGEILAPVVPKPSRCEHTIDLPGKGPVVCAGMVSWGDAGSGWLDGTCGECRRTYARPPAEFAS